MNVSNGELLRELRRQLAENERLFHRLEALRVYARETTQKLREAEGLYPFSKKLLDAVIAGAERGKGQRRRKTA